MAGFARECVVSEAADAAERLCEDAFVEAEVECLGESEDLGLGERRAQPIEFDEVSCLGAVEHGECLACGVFERIEGRPEIDLVGALTFVAVGESKCSLAAPGEAVAKVDFGKRFVAGQIGEGIGHVGGLAARADEFPVWLRPRPDRDRVCFTGARAEVPRTTAAVGPALRQSGLMVGDSSGARVAVGVVAGWRRPSYRLVAARIRWSA